MHMLLNGLILVLVLGVLKYISTLLDIGAHKDKQRLQKHFLKKEELKIAEDNGFSTEVLKKVKYKTSGKVEEIHTSPFFSLSPDKVLPGIMLSFSKTARTVSGDPDIQSELQKIAEYYSKDPELQDYSVSVCDLSHYPNETGYALLFLKSKYPLDLLQVICPSPDGSEEYIKEYSALYKKWYENKSFRILFLSPDTLHLQFLTSLTKSEAQMLAQTIYKYSPDTVDMAYDTEHGSTLALQQYALALESTGFVEFYWN
ncbi:MAG: DUF4253 domain-containing protein [Candidatus Gracilibacteria bacterium]